MFEPYRPNEVRTAPEPLRDPDDVIDGYVTAFNRSDEELYPQMIANADAAAWMKREVPFFECADRLLERVYWFRWWTYRKHITETPEGPIVSEFLPDVYWAGAYNSINDAAGHHIAEGRWLRGKDLMRNYATFWFRGSGNELSYSSWLVDAVVRYAESRDDREFAVGLLDDFVRFYQAVEERNMTRYGLFWSFDDRDAMEDSISGSGLRPTLNSYMAANARAIAKTARWAGREELAVEFDAKARTLTRHIRERLWDPKGELFKVIPLDDKDDELSSLSFDGIDPNRNVREEDVRHRRRNQRGSMVVPRRSRAFRRSRRHPHRGGESSAVHEPRFGPRMPVERPMLAVRHHADAGRHDRGNPFRARCADTRRLHARTAQVRRRAHPSGR